eukprot:TRINITY_DN5601_c0_g1_i1.p1 TRINITY_DN5601_c0_g1~~TRINITY_DN5601_c0_g1_i1.p1  ORF type:complete len:93 (+),score=6.99 TRINITY_DN5601_c0_g1_i1:115-393(+)
MDESDKAEMDELVDVLEEWAELRLPPGYNPEIVSMRINIDPVTSRIRPLVYYAVTEALVKGMTEVLMRWLGFTFHRAGSLRYWRRPPKNRGS